jgi:hypothetical protein
MDINEFIEKHRTGVDIIKGTRGLFEYYPFEREVISGVHNNQYTIIKKSRQMHLTTMLAAYVAWFMIFNENSEKSEIVYCANKLDSSKRFVDYVRSILYDYYGEEFTDKKLTNNKTEIKLKNGNSIRSHSSSVDSMRGRNLEKTYMYIFDEAAYNPSLGNFLTQLDVLKLRYNFKIVLGSTPNGFEYFHRLWDGSHKGENKYHPIDLPYHKHPKRDEKWVEEMRKLLYNDILFNQEVLGLFIQPKAKKNKSNLIQFRVSDDIMNQIGLKLIEKDVTISNYLRDLIQKDIAS